MGSNTEEIKQRLDLADLIQEYVKLTPAGGNFKARCPFHNEKTPSFMVSPEKQIWHCFGCGLGGDHFEFIKKIEGIEFPEALRILAQKANVTLDFHNPEVHSHKTKLVDIGAEIASFWHQKLKTDASAEVIRKYLEERKVGQQSIDEFMLGYSADSWDEVIKFLQNKGYSLLEISQAGLSVPGNQNRPYDRFRGRLMFPIRNVHGNVVGFGARKMKEEDTGGKYINSPQSDIYNKSEILYNLDQAKMEIKRLDYAILVEGYMDVLACHKAGTKNVVAVSGTSLTEGQIRLLKRYTQNVMIAFDADVAGTLANLRGIDLAWQSGLNVKVIHLPQGKDPDDLIKASAEEWRQLVGKADNFMDYIFIVTLENLDLTRVDHKKKAAQKLLKVIAKLGDEVERSHYLNKLAKKLGVDEESLKKVLARLKNKDQARPITAETQLKAPAINRDKVLAERFLSLLFKFPKQIPLISQQIEPEIVAENLSQEVYKKLIIYYNNKQSFAFEEFIKEFPKERESFLNKLMLIAETDETQEDPLIIKQELGQVINRLKKNYFNIKLQALNLDIAQAERQSNQGRMNELSGDFSKILSRLADCD